MIYSQQRCLACSGDRSSLGGPLRGVSSPAAEAPSLRPRQLICQTTGLVASGAHPIAGTGTARLQPGFREDDPKTDDHLFCLQCPRHVASKFMSRLSVTSARRTQQDPAPSSVFISVIEDFNSVAFDFCAPSRTTRFPTGKRSQPAHYGSKPRPPTRRRYFLPNPPPRLVPPTSSSVLLISFTCSRLRARFSLSRCRAASRYRACFSRR